VVVIDVQAKLRDAVMALIALGYKPDQADEAIRRAPRTR